MLIYKNAQLSWVEIFNVFLIVDFDTFYSCLILHKGISMYSIV